MAGKNEPSLENHQERVPMRMTSMRLELLSHHRIRDPGLGLNEPSGLTPVSYTHLTLPTTERV